jgi:hypothetical protein
MQTIFVVLKINTRENKKKYHIGYDGMYPVYDENIESAKPHSSYENAKAELKILSKFDGYFQIIEVYQS